MPSPFPGMNPYVEQPDLWRGFHNGFLFCLQAAINPQIVPRYVVYYEESIYIDRGDDEQAGSFAVVDVAVADTTPDGDRTGSAGEPATADPVTATVPIPKPTRKKRRWLTVRDAKERTVVTVIEVLSPSDKRAGKDRNRYLDKRDRILRSRANLVEIDLLRGGQRMPIDGLPACAYCVMVSRQWARPRVGLWPIHLRDPLPAIPIPLRVDDPEPRVPLKPVLDRVYDDGAYTYKVSAGQPDPPLSAADADWARAYLPPG